MADDNAFLEKIRSSVREALDEETFARTVTRMQEAVEAHMNETDVPYVVNVAANEFGITDTEEQGILDRLLDSQDMTKLISLSLLIWKPFCKLIPMYMRILLKML